MNKKGSKKNESKEVKNRKGYHPGYSPQHCVGSGSVPRSSAVPHKIVFPKVVEEKETNYLLFFTLGLAVTVAIIVILELNDVIDLKPIVRYFKAMFSR